MPSKKLGKIAFLSLLGVLSIASCSSEEYREEAIYSKPSYYYTNVITVEDDNGVKHSYDIYNNLLKVIVDAMHEGETKTKVLNEILLKYSESIYGSYDDVTAKDYELGYITLRDAVEDADTEDHLIADEFIRAHKVYWRFDANGKHIDDDGNPVNDLLPNWPVSKFERKTLKAKLKAIDMRVKEAMFNKASSAAQDFYFDETEFVKNLHKEGKKNVDYDKCLADNLNLVLADYTLEAEDVFIEDNPLGLLHKEYYQKYAEEVIYDDEGHPLDDHGDPILDPDEAEAFIKEKESSFTYIQDEIIPDVYRDLLVEQYLLDKEFPVVRDSRARKINVLKLEKYSGFSSNADALAKDLINTLYNDPKVVPTVKPEPNVDSPLSDKYDLRVDPEEIDEYYDNLFEAYSIINKGQYDVITAAQAKLPEERNDIEQYIVDIMSRIQSYGNKIYEKSPDGDFYENTSYGDLMEDYNDFLEKVTYDDYDAELAKKFTDNGKITPEEGLRKEKVKLDQNKTITKGWYIQNAGPSLDSAGEITKKLFTVTVGNAKMEVGEGTDQTVIANNYATLEDLDRFQLNLTGDAYELRKLADAHESSYVCSINGAYFLKLSDSPIDSSLPFGGDILLNDKSGNAYYVVQVTEAVKDIKLRKDGSYSYSATRGTEVLQDIVEEVSKKVAETGNYSTLSRKYWLKNMYVLFHDYIVFAYFVENYPELFEQD